MKSKIGILLKFTGVALLMLTLGFLVATKVFSVEPTLLHLRFQDQKGRPVKVTEATLVMVAGNYIDKLPLTISPKGLDIPLDAAWLRANWPGGIGRFKNMDRAYVYLKAPGYASLCSQPINWIGTEAGGKGNNMVVSFPRSRTLVVAKGRTNQLTVQFREPTDRFVRLSAGKGNPIQGARVKTFIYWSKNEDGNLNGADYLGEGLSDEKGRVRVIDGDFVYAIEVTYKGITSRPAKTVLILKRFDDQEQPVNLPE